jgi:ectoine hydroxylase-related dioxygenase (phytanoyl-CoA dioxygenase family)
MGALTPEQLESFRDDGFLVVERDFVEESMLGELQARFERLYAGDYETGIQPDEVKWVRGRDPEDVTRQVCNVWKADRAFARQLLSEETGRAVAELMGWDGSRVLQDVCIWKPPGAPPLPMHRDGLRLGYLVPPESVTCWIALDSIAAEAGGITYVRGSHRWPWQTDSATDGPRDWLAPAKAAAPEGVELELVTPATQAGGAIFHRFDTFHGYGPNTTQITSRGVITHFARADTEFHPTNVNPVYSRYRRNGDLALDEAFFPIVWTRDGRRTPWLDASTGAA